MNAQRIKLLVMDVDGTLTNGKIYMGLNGEVMKAFDVKDGYAIANMLPDLGIEPVVVTGRNSGIVARRCAELGIERLYQGESDKLGLLRGLIAEKGLDYSQVCYVGDDLNDMLVLKAVAEAGGIAACPSDAARAVREIATYVCDQPGGHGAVREIVERLDCDAFLYTKDVMNCDD